MSEPAAARAHKIARTGNDAPLDDEPAFGRGVSAFIGVVVRGVWMRPGLEINAAFACDHLLRGVFHFGAFPAQRYVLIQRSRFKVCGAHPRRIQLFTPHKAFVKTCIILIRMPVLVKQTTLTKHPRVAL